MFQHVTGRCGMEFITFLLHLTSDESSMSRYIIDPNISLHRGVADSAAQLDLAIL